MLITLVFCPLLALVIYDILSSLGYLLEYMFDRWMQSKKAILKSVVTQTSVTSRSIGIQTDYAWSAQPSVLNSKDEAWRFLLRNSLRAQRYRLRCRKVHLEGFIPPYVRQPQRYEDFWAYVRETAREFMTLGHELGEFDTGDFHNWINYIRRNFMSNTNINEE